MAVTNIADITNLADANEYLGYANSNNCAPSAHVRQKA